MEGEEVVASYFPSPQTKAPKQDKVVLYNTSILFDDDDDNDNSDTVERGNDKDRNTCHQIHDFNNNTALSNRSTAYKIVKNKNNNHNNHGTMHRNSTSTSSHIPTKSKSLSSMKEKGIIKKDHYHRYNGNLRYSNQEELERKESNTNNNKKNEEKYRRKKISNVQSSSDNNNTGRNKNQSSSYLKSYQLHKAGGGDINKPKRKTRTDKSSNNPAQNQRKSAIEEAMKQPQFFQPLNSYTKSSNENQDNGHDVHDMSDGYSSGIINQNYYPNNHSGQGNNIYGNHYQNNTQASQGPLNNHNNQLNNHINTMVSSSESCGGINTNDYYQYAPSPLRTHQHGQQQQQQQQHNLQYQIQAQTMNIPLHPATASSASSNSTYSNLSTINGNNGNSEHDHHRIHVNGEQSYAANYTSTNHGHGMNPYPPSHIEPNIYHNSTNTGLLSPSQNVHYQNYPTSQNTAYVTGYDQDTATTINNENINSTSLPMIKNNTYHHPDGGIESLKWQDNRNTAAPPGFSSNSVASMLYETSKQNQKSAQEQKQMNLSEKSKGKKCGYKPYTLKDYRQIKTNDYYEIKARTIPDLQSEELLRKKAARARQKEFSKSLNLINTAKIAASLENQASKNDSGRDSPEKDTHMLSRREKALAFAKTIPKPKSISKNSSSSGSSSNKSPVKNGMKGGSNSNTLDSKWNSGGNPTKERTISLDEIEKDELDFNEDYIFNNHGGMNIDHHGSTNKLYNVNGKKNAKYESPSRNQNVNANEEMMNHLWKGVKGKLQELEQEHYQGRREVLAMRKAFGVE